MAAYARRAKGEAHKLDEAPPHKRQRHGARLRRWHGRDPLKPERQWPPRRGRVQCACAAVHEYEASIDCDISIPGAGAAQVDRRDHEHLRHRACGVSDTGAACFAHGVARRRSRRHRHQE